MKKLFKLTLFILGIIFVISIYFHIAYSPKSYPEYDKLLSSFNMQLIERQPPQGFILEWEKNKGRYDATNRKVQEFFRETITPLIEAASNKTSSSIENEKAYQTLLSKKDELQSLYRETSHWGDIIATITIPENYNCSPAKDFGFPVAEEGPLSQCDVTSEMIGAALQIGLTRLWHEAISNSPKDFERTLAMIAQLSNFREMQKAGLLEAIFKSADRRMEVLGVGILARSNPGPFFQTAALSHVQDIEYSSDDSFLPSIQGETLIRAQITKNIFQHAYSVLGSPPLFALFKSQSLIQNQVLTDSIILMPFLDRLARLTGAIKYTFNQYESEKLMYNLNTLLLADITEYEKNPTGEFQSKSFSQAVETLSAKISSTNFYKKNFTEELLMSVAVPSYLGFVERYWKNRALAIQYKEWILQ